MAGQLNEKVAEIGERVDRLSKSPILSSVDILERREEERKGRLDRTLDDLRARLGQLEAKDSVSVEQVYGSLKEVDRLKKSIYPYGEEKFEGALGIQMKELDRKLGNLLAYNQNVDQMIRKVDERVGVLEGKISSVESLVGRIDFPIDQLKNLFSILLDTNTQMKEFELELLTVLKRLRRLEQGN